MSHKPKVSVVTIVRNDAQGFLITGRSVMRQKYPKLEWIVVDGASTDGTSDYVRRLAPRIARFTIERDNGIYSAMNKGIGMVSGEWVFFLNADDVFHEDDTVARYVEHLRDDDHVVYADAVRREDGRIHRYPPPQRFWGGMIMDHQTALVRAEVCKELRYDESYKVSGDFDFFSRARQAGCNFRKIPWLIGCRKPYDSGVSATYAARLGERVKVMRKYFDDQPWRELVGQEIAAARKAGTIDDAGRDQLLKLIER
jgi:glycosyltransferase involved in cell wall biosynthesis